MANDVERLYDTDLADAGWALVAPLLPPARPGGRPRTTNIRAVLNAIFYLLRTGCQWRLLPREFPAWSAVYHYFRRWENPGILARQDPTTRIWRTLKRPANAASNRLRALISVEMLLPILTEHRDNDKSRVHRLTPRTTAYAEPRSRFLAAA
jgi:transposase